MSKKKLKKETSEKNVADKIRDKQDDAYAFAHGIATSGVCDRCSIQHTYILCVLLGHLNCNC